MKYPFFSYVLLVLSHLSCKAQNEIKLDWSDFEIDRYKTLEVDAFDGLKEKVEWPIFSNRVSKLDGKKVMLTGFSLCEVGPTSLEDTAMKETCLITISNNYTTQLCGVPAFNTNEIVEIDNTMERERWTKITVVGILRLNTNGKQGCLIRIENAQIINKN